MRFARPFALGVWLWLAAASVARADTAARDLYDAAEAQYALGHFSNAIELYKRAYELSRRPSLLFNLAQAYRLNGDAEHAKYFYESYLRAEPDPPHRTEVEGRIREMDAALPKAGPAIPPAAEEPRPVEVRRRPALVYAGWATVGVGAVGVGLGLFFGLRARALAAEVDSATDAWTEALARAHRDGRSANRLMYVTGGLGGGLLVGGVVLLWLGRPREVVTVSPIVAPGLAGLAVGGSF